MPIAARLLGLFFATLALSSLVGMGLAGVLGDVVGVVPLLTLDCVAYVGAGGLVLVTLGRSNLERAAQPAAR
jgi:hypothetical protein